MMWGIVGLLSFWVFVAEATTGPLDLSDVVSVTPENAQQILSESSFVFVAFTIRGCGHCSALAPVWSQLATQFRGEKEALIAKVDCDEFRDSLCAQIHSFPTIQVRRRGLETPYHGKRQLEDLALFVQKQVGPAVRRVRTDADAARYIQKDAAVVVASAGCDVALLEAACERLRRRFFFVLVEYASDAVCQVEVVRMHGAEREVWDGQTSLDEFVEQEALPLVSVFDKFVHAQSRRPVVYLFHDGDVPDAMSLATFKAAARALRASTLLFCSISTEVWDGARMGVGPNYPAVGLGDTSKLNWHFAYRGELDAAPLIQWLQSYVNGTLERTRVSLPLPSPAEVERAAPVKIVVGDNFRSVVLDNSDDVLVYFRNDHCGSSVATDPIWKEFVELASARKSLHHLVLAVADGWANDWEDWVGVSGLPDIRLFPGDAKHDSKRFYGDRTPQNIWTWLETYAYHPLSASNDKEEL